MWTSFFFRAAADRAHAHALSSPVSSPSPKPKRIPSSIERAEINTASSYYSITNPAPDRIKSNPIASHRIRSGCHPISHQTCRFFPSSTTNTAAATTDKSQEQALPRGRRRRRLRLPQAPSTSSPSSLPPVRATYVLPPLLAPAIALHRRRCARLGLLAACH
jgi:hypothetical protein